MNSRQQAGSAAMFVAAIASMVLFARAQAAAAPAIVALEHAVETSAGQLELPAGGVGTIALQPCAGCKPVSLVASSSTQWNLAGQPIGFADFRQALAARPTTAVVVLYRPAGGLITRVFADAPARRQP